MTTQPAPISPGDAGQPDSQADDVVLRYVDEAAARASGAPPSFDGLRADPPPPPSVDDARHHLDEAWALSDAGTDIPDTARLRQVKRALMVALRPVTSHQVPFNREIAVAIKDLATAVDLLVGRVDGAGRDVERAVARVNAALATVELTVDDLAATVADLSVEVQALTERTTRLEAGLTDERAETRGLRSRQDIVLRAARDAVGAKATRKHLSELAAEHDRASARLSAELIDAVRGTRDEVRVRYEPLVADVVAAADGGLVADLACGRGEWLELLREHGADAYGVDTHRPWVEAGTARGLDTRRGDPIGHLSELPESSLAAITALDLADRLPTDVLVELIDRALAALRAGGVLLLGAANPTSLDVGASDLWRDPARTRPVHPDTLELAVLSRGFAEAETCWIDPIDPGLAISADDLGGTDRGRAEAVADRLNALLAGPRAYVVFARKPGPGKTGG